MRRGRRNQTDFVGAPAPQSRLELADLEESERLTGVVRAAQGGDPAAIHALVMGLSPPLLQAVRALMGPMHPDVEDLLQEVLIAVIDALPSFRGECTLLHFAIRIAARRTTAARRRSRTILGWLEQFWRNERPLVAQTTSPHRETVSDRRRTLLRTLLGELPEAQAEAMVLRLACGYSIEEIAAISSAPINTVRSRLRLAKDALRNRIEADPRWAELWGNEA
jgi:RNA polymerase sigma-70 factor (ECF subfamily)